MRGVKSIEYRSRSTKIRGRIYIYAALGRYSAEEEDEMMNQYGLDDIPSDDLARGVIVGTVELFDCTGQEGDYHWHVRNPKPATRLRKPKNHPQPSWFNPF